MRGLTSTQRRNYVVKEYLEGDSVNDIARGRSYTLSTILRITAPARRELAVELFNMGFSEREVAAQTAYKPVVIRRIISNALQAGKDVSRATEQERLEHGLKKFVDYYSAKKPWYLSALQLNNRAMIAFATVKVPQIIREAVSSLTIADLIAEPKDPYEALLFHIHYGGPINPLQLGRAALHDYAIERPEDVSVARLKDHLKDKITGGIKEGLKFPIYVDKEGLDNAMQSLTPKEQDVLRKGILGGCSLSDIAREYNRSRENIRQAESRGLRRLRHITGKYAHPQELLAYARRLEGIVAQQDTEIQKRDEIIRAYESSYGIIPGRPDYTADLGLRRKLEMPVDALELSTRASNCLKTARIRNIGQLVLSSDRSLLRTKNFGVKSLNEIKTALATMGLEMRMQLPEHLAAEFRQSTGQT